MKRRLLRICADVYLFIDREDKAPLFDAACAGYDCPICGQPGRLTEDEPASVLVDIDSDDLARRVIRIAHAACSPSRVRLVDDLDTGRETIPPWPAVTLLRPGGTDPAAVVLLSPDIVLPRWEETLNGERIDLHTAELLEQGYTLLLHLETPLPAVDGLHVDLGPGNRLTATNPGGDQLWTGTVAQPVDWVRVAVTTTKVGIVVVFGLALHNPHRDHHADLLLAIRDGAAAGATASLRHWRT